jgi:hypothetical protein
MNIKIGMIIGKLYAYKVESETKVDKLILNGEDRAAMVG